MPRDPQCDRCPLHTSAAHVCMWGKQVGARSNVMVLGLAPGFYEDQVGEPFVGPSGKLLSDALSKAGITNYYKTNTVRCYPGKDADVIERTDVKACADYLEEEIADVRPKFILAFGNAAIQRLLGRGTASAFAGKEQWSVKYGCWVLPLWHPAFVLRSPGRESGWRLDLIRYGHLISGRIPLPGKPPIRVSIVETHGDLSCLYQRLNAEDWAFDFETSRLPWWHRDFKAFCVGFAFDGEQSTVLFLDHPDNPLDPRLCRMLLSKLPVGSPNNGAARSHGGHNRRIGHNAGMFDCPVWYRLTGQIPYLSDDTMVQAHLLDENEPKGLKWQGRAKLGWPDWDVELEQKTLAKKKPKKTRPGSDSDGEGNGRLSPEEYAFYCGADTCATFLLRDAFTHNLQLDDRLWNYYVRVEMPKVRALTRLVVRGIHVDKPRLARQWALAAQNWDAAKVAVPVSNPASAEQVAAWLFGKKEEGGLGLAPLHFGKKHGSTQEEDISRLAQLHPEARAILPIRKWARYQTTYFRPIYEATRDSVDGRYHPDIRVAGAERRQGGGENSAPVTGRLSSAFHTVPRPTPEDGPFVRAIFGAPEGFSFVEADLSQIEARFAAWAAAGSPASWEGVVPRQANMLIALRDNREIYAEQAAKNIYGDPRQWQRITTNERQVMGKVPVLAMLYRISPKGLMEYAWRGYQIDWSLKQAGRIWLGFHKLWPEFQEWHNAEERKLRARGYAVTPIGRYRRLPAAMGWGKAAHEAIQAGINSPIQGVASDYTQAALILLDHLIESRGLPLRVVGDVHDALQIEAPTWAVGATGKLVKWIMEVGAAKYLEPLGLRLPPGLVKVEVKAGAWGEGRVIA